MKTTVNFTMFCDELNRAGRGSHFTYEGKRALFDYLEDVAYDYELDVVALCCDFSEYDIYSVASYFPEMFDENVEYDMDDIIEEFGMHTQAIKVSDERFIIQDF